MAPPVRVLLGQCALPWDRVGEQGFLRLLRNYGEWNEQNSAPASSGAELSSVMVLNHQFSGPIGLLSQIGADFPDARKIMREFLIAVVDGTSLQGDPAVVEPDIHGPGAIAMPRTFNTVALLLG
ncbi:hypothetical protein [Streptomyces sp. 7N604]|uniref:hypothetical protein n=1 Tax=Streptomyces sp. 7N604 TaxID=3457415 RepID=UPI003FD0FFCA